MSKGVQFIVTFSETKKYSSDSDSWQMQMKLYSRKKKKL